MGLTHQSTGKHVLDEMFNVQISTSDEMVIALAGNPNTGKSTVFNSLTGLNQHTGNWPGKTVTNAQGRYTHNDKKYVLVDLPGTYSLLANSVEEEIARDFICFGNPKATVVVTDATCLERNLILVLQILEITDQVVLCVNLMDEAKRKGIHVNLEKLSKILGIPVVGTNARDGIGLDELKDAVEAVASGKMKTNPLKIQYDKDIEEQLQIIEEEIAEVLDNKMPNRWVALQLLIRDQSIQQSLNNFLQEEGVHAKDLEVTLNRINDFIMNRNLIQDQEILQDEIVASIVRLSEEICGRVTNFTNNNHNELDRKIDNILTSRILGFLL